MKKISVLFICIAMLTIICGGCGKGEEKNKIPEGMSEKAYNTGCEVINILEHYLDMDIDASTAYDRLYPLETNIETNAVDANVQLKVMDAKLIMSDIEFKLGRYSDADVRQLVKEFKELLEID